MIAVLTHVWLALVLGTGVVLGFVAAVDFHQQGAERLRADKARREGTP